MEYHIKHFNIRVYAIILNEESDSVLVSDEYQLDMRMTKFPGGGMQFGEGTIDCLKREAIEEFGQEINVIKHFYTTDFFQQSMFQNDHQLVSIYYIAGFKQSPSFKISKIPFDFEEVNERQSFRWVKVTELKADMFTFPIDKKVAEMFRELCC